LSDRGHVFIVDGDASSADTLQELLESDGYSVGSASRGGEALEGIASAEPNLVLLDAHLADVDPFELLEEMKQTQHGRDIPVIFMTTLEDSDARVKVLEAGDDLIVKPFESREVLARIERQVTVSKVRMALRESEAKFRSVMESAIDAIISGTPRARSVRGTARQRRCSDIPRPR
jgi:DNA-binding response OmpR family regulator